MSDESEDDSHLQSAQRRRENQLLSQESLHNECLTSSQQKSGDPSSVPADEASAAESPKRASRPNKFLGPPSTWRDWTAEDRRIAASLDQLQAQDLSIHLYNTHALRAQAKAQRESAQSSGGSTGRAKLKADVWEPPKQWAAWPMPAPEVLREVERMGTDPQPYDPPRSSRRDLEEVLLATATRIARERFEAREWDSAGSESEAASGASSQSSHSIVSSLKAVQLERKPAIAEATLSEPGLEPHTNILEDAPSPDSAGVSLRPVPLADDNVAASLLLPSIRHVMAQDLDRLLYALHRTRASYAAPDAPSDDESRSRSRSRSVSSVRTPARARQSTPAPSPAPPTSTRKRKREGSESAGEESEDAMSVSERAAQEGPGRGREKSRSSPGSERSGVSRGSSRLTQKRLARLGLRDWSDVLGLAAIQGWDSPAVERARERCSALFGEDMSFMTLQMPDV